MRRIFCVEDDESIRELIEYTLTRFEFSVRGFECASDFFAALEEEMPSLVLLDLMLPDLDGMEILEKLKSAPATEKLPVILLTAKSGRVDKIKGLDSGADDYITKPFDIMELVSRTNAVLRRCESREQTRLCYQSIRLDRPSRQVFVGECEIPLTFKEFEILSLFLANPGIVFSRETLMNRIWGVDFKGESRTVDVHIRTLRQKLGAAGDCIETIRNVGYKVG